MHHIENEFLKISARNYGAELISVFDKQNQIEHLWQADPAFWGWYAPVLFPVVGRCLNDEIVFDGTKYEMEKHGFARKSDFKLIDSGDTEMIFSLTSSKETLNIYPYRFELLIGYRLQQNKLICSYEVINKDDKTIYFQLGGHPAFAVPFTSPQPLSEREGLNIYSEKYEDYYLEFEKEETSSRHLINEDGYFDGRKDLVLNNSNRIPLKADLFKDDALIFKDLKSSQVSIRSINHSNYLSVDFTGFNYLGLWAKENAPYVCIEPWHGCADTANLSKEFSQKEGIISLAAGEEFNSAFVITIG